MNENQEKNEEKRKKLWNWEEENEMNRWHEYEIDVRKLEIHDLWFDGSDDQDCEYEKEQEVDNCQECIKSHGNL